MRHLASQVQNLAVILFSQGGGYFSTSTKAEKHARNGVKFDASPTQAA